MKLTITGRDARDIADHVRTFVRPGRHWTEVQVMDECSHGCKLHVRRQGAVLRFALLHNRAYGCRSDAQPVPVSVRPAS